MPTLYSAGDYKRESEKNIDSAPWRPSFSRDYGRVVHSASFRRLQGKTQVFPGHESDFFRNRLTHSLEVAQIAEGIADRLNHEDSSLKALNGGTTIDPRLCAVAGLIHDLGHPPFGHNGERALDDAMRRHGGFEGNAQTLRIVSRLEKKIQSKNGQPFGLDLCYRTLAAVLKYDREIPRSRRSNSKLEKGYYFTEADLVRKIKKFVVGDRLPADKKFKTLECSIMDLADDIAYSTFDLEDSLKAGFLTPSDMISSSDELLKKVAEKVSDELGRSYTAGEILDVFTELFSGPSLESSGISEEDDDRLLQFSLRYSAYREMASSGYLRTKLSSQLVKEAINAIELDFDSEYPMLSQVKLAEKVRERVEVLKQYTFIATIYSSRVKLPEYRGYEVVSGIFKALAGSRGYLLMPDDVRHQHELVENDLDAQMRVVCDFVAGMTDRYAMEFYGRLHSDTAQSMFKPV